VNRDRAGGAAVVHRPAAEILPVDWALQGGCGVNRVKLVRHHCEGHVLANSRSIGVHHRDDVDRLGRVVARRQRHRGIRGVTETVRDPVGKAVRCGGRQSRRTGVKNPTIVDRHRPSLHGRAGGQTQHRHRGGGVGIVGQQLGDRDGSGGSTDPVANK